MGKQTIVIRFDGAVVRAAERFLSRAAHGYESLDEFVQIAVRNQLAMEEHGEEAVPTVPATERFSQPSSARTSGAALAKPAGPVPEPLARPQAASGERLFVLTNRLSPIKLATRVLAWAGSRGAWPALEGFQEEAAQSARDFGLRLRSEDETAGRSGPSRRWIAYPVGDDERAALNRFIASFTMQVSGDTSSGPMALLGLANVVEGRASLTETGWSLAIAPSPLMDGADGVTLSREEAAILLGCVLRAPGERDAVTEFLQTVKRAAGHQPRIDELLAARYPDWTETLTIAHRSALIGRVSELGLLEITGRGPKAQVTLLAAADEFLATSTQGVA